VTPAKSPVPQEVSQELERVVRRWRELPLGRALSCMPGVRRLLDDLARADPGSADVQVPDLGPAVVMDQLTVLVYDRCEAGAAPGLAERLAELRRGLA
jgi:hypothetical protein